MNNRNILNIILMWRYLEASKQLKELVNMQDNVIFTIAEYIIGSELAKNIKAIQPKVPAKK